MKKINKIPRIKTQKLKPIINEICDVVNKHRLNGLEALVLVRALQDIITEDNKELKKLAFLSALDSAKHHGIAVIETFNKNNEINYIGWGFSTTWQAYIPIH